MSGLIQLSDLSPETWLGGRDGGSDFCGEWVPHSSWTFERVLMRAINGKIGHHRAPPVKLVLRIHGKQSGAICRATAWSGRVTYGQEEYRTDRFRGKCKSCKDARQQVMEHPDLCRVITQTLRRAYSPLRAECIYQYRDGAWEPWMTLLRIDWHEACWNWPVGDYEVRAWNDHWNAKPGEVRAFRLQRSQCGLSSGGIGERPDLECWLPELSVVT